jgi:hypothetical protein
MEGKERLEGKEIIVFYDDFNGVGRKEGLCTADTDIEIEIDNSIVIQKRRLIRIEVIR